MFNLGVQSFTFRNFKTLDELIGVVKKAGIGFVEVMPGHISPDASEADISAGLKKFKSAGIAVSSYGVCNFSSDEKADRKIFEIGKMAGLKAISADIDPDAVSLAEKLAEEYGIKLAVHNHGRAHRYGSMVQLNELFGKSGKSVGICLDTAWMLDSGEDVLEAVEAFSKRLYGVHLKDFRFNPDGSHEDVVVGDGSLDLRKFFGALESVKFGGYMSIEYEGEPDNPLPSILEAVSRVKRIIGR